MFLKTLQKKILNRLLFIFQISLNIQKWMNFTEDFVKYEWNYKGKLKLRRSLSNTKDQPIKLQLNSEAAIRSIIEGDPELQIEIKNKIACAIAHGYEKINTETIKDSVETLTYEVSKIVYDNLTDDKQNGWRHNRVLKPEVQEMIQTNVLNSIKVYVDNAINEAKIELQVRIKDEIEIMSDQIMCKIINEVFETNVRNEVIRRLNAVQKTIDGELKS